MRAQDCRTLLLRRTEAQIVAVRIGHRKFPKSPGLIDGCGMQRGIRAARSVQAPSPERRVSLVDVIDKDAIDRTEDAVSRVTRKLKLSAIESQVDHTIRHLLLFVSWPFAFEIENSGVEIQRLSQITDLHYGHDLHSSRRFEFRDCEPFYELTADG
jgi:hypothetical protein